MTTILTNILHGQNYVSDIQMGCTYFVKNQQLLIECFAAYFAVNHFEVLLNCALHVEDNNDRIALQTVMSEWRSEFTLSAYNVHHDVRSTVDFCNRHVMFIEVISCV